MLTLFIDVYFTLRVTDIIERVPSNSTTLRIKWFRHEYHYLCRVKIRKKYESKNEMHPWNNGEMNRYLNITIGVHSTFHLAFKTLNSLNSDFYIFPNTGLNRCMDIIIFCAVSFGENLVRHVFIVVILCKIKPIQYASRPDRNETGNKK